MAIRKVYWDTSCFISFLSSTHPEEQVRAEICLDVLDHARAGDIELWTSVWTIVETIRPKEKYVPKALPPWSEALDVKDSNGTMIYPTAKAHLEVIWNYHGRSTIATRTISAADATKISRMFAWPFIRKIQIVPTIAERAADIARAHNLKPADSLHVASAIARGCDSLQCWDRDYTKTDSLIRSESPVRISPPNLLTNVSAIAQSPPSSPASKP